MAFRLGEELDYNPFDYPGDQPPVVDSPTRFSLGEAMEVDPFEYEPRASDLDEPDEQGHSLWDIPRLMGRGAAGVAKTASMVHSILNPAEWAARTAGVIGDFTQAEALQTFRDYSNQHGVSAQLKQVGETAEDYYDEKLTPAMKRSMQQRILASSEEEGFFGEGATNPWKIGGMIAEAIPSTAISMGSGALITKGLIQTGLKSAPKIVQGVVNKLVDKFGVPWVAGIVGGAAGEGTYSGLENANQAYEEMQNVPQEKMAQSKTYQEIYNSLPARFTDEQKHAYARKILSTAAAGFIGSITAVTTAVLGAPSGAFLGKLIGGEAGKSFWGNLIKGAITEGIFEEAPQSAVERLVTNITTKFLVDPNQEVGEDVLESLAAGAVTGMFMGGGMAVLAGREGRAEPTARDILTDGEDVTAKDILVGEDEAARMRRRAKDKEFVGPESIEAEEEAAEFAEKELEEVIPPPLPTKEAPSDRPSPPKREVPGKKPQRKEPVKAPELPSREKEIETGRVLQEPKPDEVAVRQHRQNIIDQIGERAGVKLRYDRTTGRGDKQVHAVTIMSGPRKGTKVNIPGAMTGAQIIDRLKKAAAPPARVDPDRAEFDKLVKSLTPAQRKGALDLIKDEAMPIKERLGLLRAELAAQEYKTGKKPERRAEPERPPWDAPIRALYTEAQAQPEERWTATARKRAEAEDPMILDLARRMGQTIEPDTDLDDAMKTVYSRIKAGMQPRKRIQEMDDEELRTALNEDFLTGLKSKHAFEVEDERKKHVASIDLDSLKFFNDTFGHQAGDEMLIQFGNALKGIDADAYHISGDEYVVQHDDEAELKRILDEDVVANLKKFPIRVTLPDGQKIEVEVQFSYGTGQTISESEEALHAHKAWREATGKRAGRGEVPRQIYEQLTEGRPVRARREEIPERRPGEQVGGPRRAPVRGRPSPEAQIAADEQKLEDAAAEVDTTPTPAQKEAGNYKKGHLYNFMGFDITLENPKGSIRSGTDRRGRPWSIKMKHHYGDFKGTEGAEGDKIDVFIGDDLGSERFFIVDQRDPETLEFDEHKTLIGFPNQEAARLGYLSNYEKGWKGLGAITEMTRPQFEAWLAKGRQTKAVKYVEPKAPPEPEVPAAPEPEPEAPAEERGNQTKIITPGNPRGYKAYYTIMDADAIIPSHDAASFRKNPDYPEGIQERTYHSDPREQEKVVQNARRLAPSILLSDDPTPTNGPPIVFSTSIPGKIVGVVLGGNSRAMSLQRAYQYHPKLGKKYKAKLIEKAESFGVSKSDAEWMSKPVLVRVVYMEKEDIQTMHRMASDFNKALTLGMSQEAEIASMGKNISVETIEKVGLRMANRDLTLRELLGKKDGVEILRWLIQDNAVSAADENRFVNQKLNLLNDAGKDTIEKAFFGSIIDDADLISAAPKSYLNKIGRALPSLARIKARGDQWDITPQLKNALELATAAKASDLSIREHLKQQPLFEAERKTYDDIERALAFRIESDTQTLFAKAFKAFAVDAMADVKDQTFMFPPKDFETAFKDAFQAEVKEPEPAPPEPAKTTGELVQMSFDDFLKYLKTYHARTGEASGIAYVEQVEIEETGDLVERETDAIAYHNQLDDDIAGYRDLVKCLTGRTP